MKISQFEIHLASYGTDLARWPSALRDAAEALVAASEEARAFVRAVPRLATAV